MTMKKAIYFLLLLSACQSQALNDAQNVQFESEGIRISQAVMTALSQELKSVIQKKGIEKAIEHCNLRALPITDSLAKHYDVKIKRTTLQTRNPDNIPDLTEVAILRDFTKRIAQNEKIKPQVSIFTNEEILFTSPIFMQSLCLNCHGKNISKKVSKLIQEKYPKDQATGYKEGDFRGIWSIRFLRSAH